ncbi:MAG: DUF6186 family protein [Acidimicrobiales bacterium]
MSGRDWSFLVWACLGGAVLAWLVITWVWRERLATLGAVVSGWRRNRVARVLLVVGWMWLGWHAFAR